MGEITRATAKKPEVKSEKSASRKRHVEASQSIYSPADRILYLQRTIGNQAVQRLIKSRTMQAKLNIGQPGDKYEQEADRVADTVMRMPAPQASYNASSYIQRACPECKEDELRRQPIEEEGKKELQAKPTSSHISQVNPNLESRIHSLKGGGQLLSENDRAYFEPRFGHDFNLVRVHTDAKAAESARAFTVGQDVVFGIRQYAPETILGRDFPNLKNRISSTEVVNTSEPRIDSKYQVR